MWLIAQVAPARAACPPSGDLAVAVGDVQRTAQVAIPAVPAGALVLDVHGSFDSPEVQRRGSGLAAMVESGAIVAWPQSRGPTWNAGACCGPAQWAKHEDTAFLDALATELLPCAQAQTVRVAGFSNGAFLAERWSCESTQVSAVVSVGGGWMDPTCTSAPPVSFLGVHGDQDRVVPYAGGSGSRTLGVYDFPGFEANLERWRQRNRCSDEPPTTWTRGDLACRVFSCAAPTAACVVQGGGHTWPGAPPRPINGSTSAVALGPIVETWWATGQLPVE